MAECQVETEEVLRSGREPRDKKAEPGGIEFRDLTIRGAECVSNLFAVRCQVVESPELPHFQKSNKNHSPLLKKYKRFALFIPIYYFKNA